MIREFVSLKPPCMSDDEYTRWGQLNQRTGGLKVVSVCADCLRPFAEEMRLAGRCDGEPGESQAGRHSQSDDAYLALRASWRRASRKYRAAAS